MVVLFLFISIIGFLIFYVGVCLLMWICFGAIMLKSMGMWILLKTGICLCFIMLVRLESLPLILSTILNQ